MLTPQKMKFLHLTADHKYSITDLILKHQIQDTTLTSMYTCRKRKMKKTISKPFHWTMKTQPLKKFLTDHCAYKNIHYHMDYAHTHVHRQITRLLPTSRPLI